MSILVLDHTQRLNLHALIGSQRANVDDMRLYWKVQDRIELSPDEKEAIGWHLRQNENGPPQIAWDSTRWLAPKEIEFSPDEVQKIVKVVKEWQPGYLINADRMWLEPLLGQLENGSGPTQQSPVPSRNQ